MSRCDGVRTVAEIVADLERTFGVTGLSGDVASFVALALDKHWLELRE
jgi:pyrroloquinoline quinone biosynthesis protein D